LTLLLFAVVLSAQVWRISSQISGIRYENVGVDVDELIADS